MNTKEEVKQKQVKSAIDYKRYYIDYLSNLIEENLKKIREINNMPEKVVNERIVEEKYKWARIEEQNRELSNKELGD